MFHVQRSRFKKQIFDAGCRSDASGSEERETRDKALVSSSRGAKRRGDLYSNTTILLDILVKWFYYLTVKLRARSEVAI